MPACPPLQELAVGLVVAVSNRPGQLGGLQHLVEAARIDGAGRFGVLRHVVLPSLTPVTIFLLLFQRLPWIRQRVASRGGVLATAAVFGPCVWLAMSAAIVPLFTHRPPPITLRWWVQFVGHAPCVGLPIVASIARTDQNLRASTSRMKAMSPSK
jgi:hypothetical protein